KNGGDDGDEYEHRRSGVDLGTGAAADKRIDLDRECHRVGTGGEEGDDEIIERQREGEERTGDKTRHHERHENVPEGLPFAGAEILRCFFKLAVEADKTRTHDDGDE